VSRVLRARLGYFTGVVIVAVGVFLALGLGWALVAAGVGTAAAFVFLYDVSEPSDATVIRQGGDDW
jgi:hypothetical protein